ncbi:MAG: response regulator transcription factor [Saprospiraceae bacterium]|nr:response regulator transcription factor [Saprospiraceae bacterium]
MTKILICDDHPVVTGGLREILESFPDSQVVEVIHSANAIPHAIHYHTPDILFLDINMEGVNTLEQLTEIKQMRPNLGIIVFTSYNLPALVQRAFADGASAFLLKSSSNIEILDACTAVLSGQRFIGSEVKLRKSDRMEILDNSTTPEDVFDIISQLTEREKSVFLLAAQGKTESEIAATLFLSKHTVHTHRKNIMGKLGLHSSADFVRLAAEIDLKIR